MLDQHQRNVGRVVNALRCWLALTSVHPAVWIEALRAVAEEIEQGKLP